MLRWHKFGSKLFDFIFPQHCVLCDAKSSTGVCLCQPCWNEFPRLQHACLRCALPLPDLTVFLCGTCLTSPPPFALALAASHYQDQAAWCLSQFKFHAQFSIAPIFVQLLHEKIKGYYSSDKALPQAIIAVPLHPSRLKERGFNQAALFARLLAKKLSLPWLANPLIRRYPTPPQTGLNAKQRKLNVHHAFSIIQAIPFSHVALVDDVLTTTHTVRAVADALKKSGVAHIDLWVAARASN